MILQIPGILSPEELVQARTLLEQANWANGDITAGSQSAQVKNNLQLPHNGPEAEALRDLIQNGLARSGIFFSAALPKQLFPPLFNCYREGMGFGNHVDNAVRNNPFNGTWVRTDISCTLFLNEPTEYEGGELIVEDTYGIHSVKGPAGSVVLYPSTSIHRVETIRQGARYASFFWIQSMVRDDSKRELLFNMDLSISNLREQHGDTDALVNITSSYHNLLRMWTEV
ncbi:Fe2+-dependent dioxygenase [Neisseriaceae bacterium TC5R-5]|nr:Fe2+-dependent dioxygenase [Neisseriaceae bacterium TC5R-5]